MALPVDEAGTASRSIESLPEIEVLQNVDGAQPG
jgi:hypothetical protein